MDTFILFHYHYSLRMKLQTILRIFCLQVAVNSVYFVNAVYRSTETPNGCYHMYIDLGGESLDYFERNLNKNKEIIQDKVVITNFRKYSLFIKDPPGQLYYL